MTNNSFFSSTLVAIAVCAALASPAQAAREDLGTAGRFTVLSAEPGQRGAVTCTDASVIGDVGSSGFPPAVVQTRCSIQGSVIAPVSPEVIADFNEAFEKLGNSVCNTILTGTQAGVTLAPGVYCFDEAAALTGTLTLNGPAGAQWRFLVNGDLTGNTFTILMAGGAQACNVFWVPSGATTMTTSNLKGNVLAGAAITLTDGTFNGRALASQAVTLTRVAVTGCPDTRR